jgi:hypothetical protein
MNMDLRRELSRYGAADASIKLLASADQDPSLLRYVDLFPQSMERKGLRGTAVPDGVVEYEDRPLIYLYRADSLARDPTDAQVDIEELIRGLACRGDGSYLAVVRSGQLDLYPIALSAHRASGETISADSDLAAFLVPDLASGNGPVSLRQQLAAARSLHSLLFELITNVAKNLRESGAISITPERDEVLPLVGRALFCRFLIDRGIINPATFPALYANASRPEDAFSTPELASRTCAWLDRTFNGDLLPLLFDVPHPKAADYLAFFSRQKLQRAGVLHQLTNVMFRAPNGRLSLELSWEGVDFAHVPIGLLSEVYEDYAHQFYRDAALLESVRYTPRHIAEFTVAHAFLGLPIVERSTARVLDPAAGAGIFLVLALQRLVVERWNATGVRPDTAAIRHILNQQIRGLDINHSALTLAALSLYLTALELDPDPFPPEKLRFDRLLGSVLFNVRGDGAEKLVLGSLGRVDRAAPSKGFDIVTGNPPWTSYSAWGTPEQDFNAYASDMVRGILAKRRADSTTLQAIGQCYEHNDLLPDTAFLWRAIDWARDDGVIAFIVAGRLLFKKGDTGARVRNALLQSMQVTGILNGALLTPIWPQVNQPFCILFAINRVPSPASQFIMLTPTLDAGPAGEPRMRIDAEARQPIQLESAIKRPYLFKALTRGGRLDMDIIERILSLTNSTQNCEEDGELGETIDAPVAVAHPIADQLATWGRGRTRIGQGYIPVGKNTKKVPASVPARMATLVAAKSYSLTSDDLVDSDGERRIGLRISAKQLARFLPLALYRLAEPSLFDPPLVIINEGFGESPQLEPRARLYVGTSPLVFRRNFYGISCGDHPRPKQLAKLLFCIINSDLFGYYTLMTSAKFGLERRTLLTEDFKAFPIFDTLADRQWDAVERAADNLEIGVPASWKVMNDCINALYGLTPADEQVMQDTLATMMPYESAQTRAMAPATAREVEKFRVRLASLLEPFFDPEEEPLVVSTLGVYPPGWRTFEVRVGSVDRADVDLVTRLAAQLADDEGASRLFQVVGSGRIRVAIRNQYRYLTLSRARLCAIDIMREQGAVFPINTKA